MENDKPKVDLKNLFGREFRKFQKNRVFPEMEANGFVFKNIEKIKAFVKKENYPHFYEDDRCILQRFEKDEENLLRFPIGEYFYYIN